MTQSLYQQGVEQYRAGNLDAALGLFRRYTTTAPKDPLGFVAIGVILQEQGQIEQAVEVYEVAVELRDDCESHLQLGKTLSLLRRTGRAGDEERHLRRAIELDPNCAEAWHRLSDLQRALGAYDDAIASGKRSVQLAPDKIGYQYKLGLAHFFAGQDTLAVQAFMSSNRLAINKWDIALDGKQAGRQWFSRPTQTTELLPENSGGRYGQRLPNVLGQSNWPLPHVLYQEQPVYLVEQEHVFMEGLHGLVYDDQRMFTTDHVMIQGIWRFFTEMKLTEQRETIQIPKLASLHQPDNTNYYHWMVECLTRLLLLEPTLQRDSEIAVLTPRSRKAVFVDQSLELMGLPGEQRLENRANRSSRYFAEMLYYVDWQSPTSTPPTAELAAVWYPPRSGLRMLRERLAGESLPAADRRLVIYVRRAEQEVRHVKGDDHLIQGLQKLFGERLVVFSAEGRTVSEQISLFRQARLVLGPHGAGLTNILFCSAGTVVVEFPIVPAVLNHFAHLAMALDHDYWVTTDLTANYEGNYELDSATSGQLCEQLSGLY